MSRTSSTLHLRTSTKAKASKLTRKPKTRTQETNSSMSLEMTQGLTMLEQVFVTGLPLRRGSALSTVLRRTFRKTRVSKPTREPKMKLLPTMIVPLKTLMAFMTPLPPSSIVPRTPNGLELLDALNTLPRKEVEIFWNAVIASGRSPRPMLFRPTPIWSHSFTPVMYAPTLTDTVLTKLLTPATPKPKPIPKPRTTFFSLPTELRQKTLLMIFETHKLHYILHSPTSDVDFMPCLDKHVKKWLKAIEFLAALPKKLDGGMRFGLWDDVIYVKRFWHDELIGLLKQSRELRGKEDPVEEAGYDSDESDEEEGRVYFDCVEGRVAEGEE